MLRRHIACRDNYHWFRHGCAWQLPHNWNITSWNPLRRCLVLPSAFSHCASDRSSFCYGRGSADQWIVAEAGTSVEILLPTSTQSSVNGWLSLASIVGYSINLLFEIISFHNYHDKRNLFLAPLCHGDSRSKSLQKQLQILSHCLVVLSHQRINEIHISRVDHGVCRLFHAFSVYKTPGISRSIYGTSQPLQENVRTRPSASDTSNHRMFHRIRSRCTSCGNAV